jgi:hypothetical protein
MSPALIRYIINMVPVMLDGTAWFARSMLIMVLLFCELLRLLVRDDAAGVRHRDKVCKRRGQSKPAKSWPRKLLDTHTLPLLHPRVRVDACSTLAHCFTPVRCARASQKVRQFSVARPTLVGARVTPCRFESNQRASCPAQNGTTNSVAARVAPSAAPRWQAPCGQATCCKCMCPFCL